MELVRLIRLQWDRSLAIVLAVSAGVMLFVGWLRVSDGIVVTQQLPYVVSAGLGGIFLLGIAATLWLSADFRDEWRALENLAERGRPSVGDGDTTLVEAGFETVDVDALNARIELLETRLAAVECKPVRSRTRKIVAQTAAVTASRAD